MATEPSQPTIYEPCDAQYGLFYWINFRGDDFCLREEENNARVRELTRRLAMIHQTSQRVDDPTGLKVGIGFGKKFLERIFKLLTNTCTTENPNNAKESIRTEFEDVLPQLHCKNRIKEPNCIARGGDVFVHAKGNSVGTLYEFLNLFIDSLDEYHIEIDRFMTSVTRGFAYQHHRDISGYIYGIASPVTADERRNATVIFNTGASFALTQIWRHEMDEVKVVRPDNETVNRQNQFIGIERENGKLLSPVDRPAHAHVQLMKAAQGSRRIVRQSLPYTEEHGSTGLFFLAYANNTAVFGDMLDTMKEGEGDLLFSMSTSGSGAYWYFPGMTTLHNLQTEMEW